MNWACANKNYEFRAGRLHWTMEDVKRLIKPYRKNKAADRVFAAMEDDTALEPDEKPYASDDDKPDQDDDDEDEPYASDEDEGDDDEDQGDDADDENGVADPPQLRRSQHDSLAIDNGEADEHVQRSCATIRTLREAMQSLKAVGAVSAVTHLENEIR